MRNFLQEKNWLQVVLDQESSLTRNGLCKGKSLDETDWPTVQVCQEWLKDIKVIHSGYGYSSYSLKHSVEKFFGIYISNGAFIAAIILKKIPYQKRCLSPNIFVKLSKEDLRRKEQHTHKQYITSI